MRAIALNEGGWCFHETDLSNSTGCSAGKRLAFYCCPGLDPAAETEDAEASGSERAAGTGGIHRRGVRRLREGDAGSRPGQARHDAARVHGEISEVQTPVLYHHGLSDADVRTS